MVEVVLRTFHHVYGTRIRITVPVVEGVLQVEAMIVAGRPMLLQEVTEAELHSSVLPTEGPHRVVHHRHEEVLPVDHHQVVGLQYAAHLPCDTHPLVIGQEK